ncbi:Uncharacterized protein APZ42_024182 [Daphnia magna]|uniref:Uncharacterized protein n=1 Tax=Daphnia magna TaxID=35525 RepID=A0A164UI16_9CRUS|nr:Uncharacterized protein APZ42_024182 [Daphnia magna]
MFKQARRFLQTPFSLMFSLSSILISTRVRTFCYGISTNATHTKWPMKPNLRNEILPQTGI